MCVHMFFCYIPVLLVILIFKFFPVNQLPYLLKCISFKTRILVNFTQYMEIQYQAQKKSKGTTKVNPWNMEPVVDVWSCPAASWGLWMPSLSLLKRQISKCGWDVRAPETHACVCASPGLASSEQTLGTALVTINKPLA